MRAYGRLAAFTLMGGAALVAQVLAMRELMAVLRGNELTLALTLGVWLSLAGIFSWAGTKIIGRIIDKTRLFSLCFFALSLVLPPMVIVPRLLLPAFGYAAGEVVPAGGMFLLIIATLMVLAPLAGLMFPLAVSIMEETHHGGAGKVYAFEALGSILAGLSLTFIIAPRLTPLQGAAATSGLCLAAVFLLSFSKGARALGLTAVFFAALMAFLFFVAPGLELKSYNRGVTAGRVVEAVQSKYGAITVQELPGQHAIYAGGVYSFSIPDRDLSERKAHMPMIIHKSPSEVLLIGGGGEGVLSEILKHPVRRVDYVEQDPKLIEVSMRYMPEADRRVFRDGRVSVHYADGRSFVKDAAGKYDLVMVCLPEPSTAAVNRYYTREFFSEVKRVLKPGGILSISLPSSPNYIGRRQLALNGSIYHTLRSVFSTVRVTPEDTNYFFASMDKGAVNLDLGVLAGRFEARGISAQSFNQYTIRFFLQPGRVEYVEDRLSHSAGLGLNRDSRPLSYLYSLALWGEVAGLPALDWLAPGQTGRSSLARIVLPLTALFAVFLILARSGLNGRVFFAVGTTGFAGMVVEVAALLAFQSYYGYLYEMLGLLMALFMLGLFTGSRLAAGPRLMRRRPFRSLVLLESGFLLLALGVMLMTTYPAAAFSGAALSSVIFLAGFLTGAEFPVALVLSGGAEGGLPGRAGQLYGVDLIGSSMGALLSGVVLIPLLGIAFTAVFVLILKAVSVGFLLAGDRAA